jgi:hypothetical protein
MWVRSQNKLFFGDYKFFWVDDNLLKGSDTTECNNYDVLGEYETEEEDLKVLDSIERLIVCETKMITLK